MMLFCILTRTSQRAYCRSCNVHNAGSTKYYNGSTMQQADSHFFHLPAPLSDNLIKKDG